MDFVEIDLTKIKALCIIQPIEDILALEGSPARRENTRVRDSDNVYKSICDSFDRFCQSKKNML